MSEITPEIASNILHNSTMIDGLVVLVGAIILLFIWIVWLIFKIRDEKKKKAEILKKYGAEE